MPTHFVRFVSLIGLATTSLALAAAGRPVHTALPILRPGDTQLDVSHLRDRHDSTAVSLPDTSSPGGKRTVFVHNEEHLVDDPRGPALLLVNTNPGYVDSAIVLRATLSPIREVQNYLTRRRRLVFDYRGNSVDIRDSASGAAAGVRHHTYDGEFFHFNELSVLLRSLPLRAGYEAIVPLYSEGSDTLEMDSVRVVGKNERGEWTVRFADPVIVRTQTIDSATRRVISAQGARRP